MADKRHDSKRGPWLQLGPDAWIDTRMMKDPTGHKGGLAKFWKRIDAAMRGEKNELSRYCKRQLEDPNEPPEGGWLQ